MAIRHVESFEFTLPLVVVDVDTNVDSEALVTLDRDQATQLCRDLMTALGIGFGTYMPHDDLDDDPEEGPVVDYNEPAGHLTLSPEEAAARAQILAQAQQAEAASHAEMQRRRGNAIGSGPMH